MAILPLKYLTYKDNHDRVIDTLNTNLKLVDWAINKGQLDGNNISAKYISSLEISANQITSGRIDANTVVIDNLAVGQNVAFGENVIVAWDQVNKELASPYDIGAIPINPNTPTAFGSNWVYTGTLTAQQINAVQGIKLGSNASITWGAGGVNVPTAAQVGARPSNWLPTVSEIGAVAKNQTAVFNALTNNGINEGLYLSNGELYINASYIDTGTIRADLIDTNALAVKRLYSSTGLSGYSLGLNTNAGDLSIYSPSNNVVFQVRNDFGAWNMYADGSNFLGYNSTINKTFPKGIWDFGAATVTGLGDSLVVYARYA